MPNMIQLDYLKRQLDKTYDRTGIEEYALFARDLLNAAVDAVPEYGVAVKLGGAKITETEKNLLYNNNSYGKTKN